MVAPAPVTVEAADASGAIVYFSASSSDAVDGAITPVCTPSSGSTFSIGTTVVTCSSTDARGNTGSADFIVTVLAPARLIVVEASSPTGATVVYPSPYDGYTVINVPPYFESFHCPNSGSVFPLGTTYVDCVEEVLRFVPIFNAEGVQIGVQAVAHYKS